MKNTIKFLSFMFIVLLTMNACEKETTYPTLKDVKFDVDFEKSGQKTSFLDGKTNIPLTLQTPSEYIVALKSATLIGKNNTLDFELFNESNIDNSLAFDFEDNTTAQSLLQSSEIPEGEYESINLDIYYLQMKINIVTISNGPELRRIRIYMSDDAEYQNGVHQPGDMTQISLTNNDVEEGWLLGEGQHPDMMPISTRTAAYTTNGDGVNWYQFADKNGQNYGPFGDLAFWNSKTQPIFSQNLSFDLENLDGDELIINFNINECWQFEDINGDGNFGAEDLDPINPSRWHMQMPTMTVSLQ